MPRFDWRIDAAFVSSLLLLVAALCAIHASIAVRDDTSTARALSLGSILAGGVALTTAAVSTVAMRRQRRNLRAVAEQLHESVERIAGAMESIPEGIVIVDSQARVLWANPAGRALLGTADLGGQLSVPQPPHWNDLVRHAEHTFAGADGKQVVIAYSSTPLRAPDGSATSTVFSIVDVTERKAVEQMREQFVSAVSHELRTPLSSLRGFTELMLSREYPRETQRQFLTIIQAESSRLARLLDDFLDIQRMRSGRQHYEFASTDILPLVNDVVALFQGDRNAHPIRLEVEPHTPCVLADPARLRQVLCNLVSNAIKFSPNGGQITISAHNDNDTMVFCVADQGVGIPASEIPKLFTKFFRIESGETRHVGGTGLGLALVREIVEAHGGRVWAESRAGTGSSFFFTLHVVVPDAVEPAAQQSEAQATIVTGMTADVLLVTDEVDFARRLVESLRRQHVVVATAASLQAAAAALRVHPPRLLAIDIHVRSAVDGWDLLTSLTSDHELTPVSALVLSVSDAATERGVALPNVEVLIKPISRARVISAVRGALPAGGEGVVLIADEDHDGRKRLCKHVRDLGGVSTLEASNAEDALSLIARQPLKVVLLSLSLTQRTEGDALFELYRSIRSQRVPLFVLANRTISAIERTALKRRLARLVSADDAGVDQIASAALSLLNTRDRDHAESFV
jgi:signal transduction histidine kinase/CheY-like chemotaxis protein